MSRSGYKGTKFNASFLQNFTEEKTCLICLSPHQIQLLLMALAPARWSTRWENPGEYNFDYVVAELERDLTAACDGFDENSPYYVSADGCRIYQGTRLVIDVSDCASNQLGEGEDLPEDLDYSATNKDCVWYACEQVVAYILDKLNDILDILDLAIDALDALLRLISLVWAPMAQLLTKRADYVELFTEIGSAGVAFVRGLINDENFAIERACELFNQITCGKDAPYVYDPENDHSVHPDGLLQEWLFSEVAQYGIKRNYLRTTFALYVNDPSGCNDNWSNLCPTCPDETWSFYIDFTVASYEDVYIRYRDSKGGGVWVPGSGWWSSNRVGYGNDTITMEIFMGADTNITEVTAEFVATQSYRNPYYMVATDVVRSTDSNYIHVWSGDITVSKFNLGCDSITGTNETVGLKNVLIKGTGINPFV